MKRRSLFLLLAAGLASAVLFAAPAQAGSIIVTSDSGGGTANVFGSATGAQINTVGFADTITLINGSAVSIPLAFGVNLIDKAGVFSGTGTKDIGTPESSGAQLHFLITGAAISGPGNDTLTVDGKVALVSLNNLPGYDFSHMIGANVVVTVTNAGTDFTTVLNHPGTNALNSAMTLSQLAIPEPASMALLGIGMTGFLAFRRLFKRASVA